jgi:hypothetical protein
MGVYKIDIAIKTEGWQLWCFGGMVAVHLLQQHHTERHI